MDLNFYVSNIYLALLHKRHRTFRMNMTNEKLAIHQWYFYNAIEWMEIWFYQTGDEAWNNN